MNMHTQIKTLRKFIQFTLIVALLSPAAAYAQRVQPMVFELEPFGNKASASLRVENTLQQAITVEFVPTKISLDEKGNETLTPADDDFLIYPPQSLIQPGKTQIVRVKYIGDPAISASEAYRVSVKQLPVDMKAAGISGVGMVINFNTLLNVSPAKAKSNLAVTSVAPLGDEKWEVTIENTGNRFARLSRTSWELSNKTGDANKKLLKNLEVGEITEKNLVLPNSTLRLVVPKIEGFDASNVQIAITDKG